MYNTNLTVSDSGSVLNYNLTSNSCGTVLNQSSCIWGIRVTVPAATAPQEITVTTNGTWRNPDNSLNATTTTTVVTVSSNPQIAVISPANKKFETSVHHNLTTLLGTLVIGATGNDGVTDSSADWIIAAGDIATKCPTCSISLTTTSFGFLVAGDNFSTNVSITVPAGQSPDGLLGFVRASSSNAGTDDATINVTVLTNLSWGRDISDFGTILAAPNTTGTIGNIEVENRGNVKIPFAVLKSGTGAAFVTLSPANAFDLDKTARRNVSNTYTISSGATPGLYPVTVFIRNTSATPTELTTTYTLNITNIPPTMSAVNISPTVFETIETVVINATITDNTVVDGAFINVTRPDSTIFTQQMNRSGSFFNTTYTTTVGGNHTVRICSNDTSGLEGCTNAAQITAVSNTSITTQSNTTSVTVNNVTLTQSDSFGLNITMNNTGNARALNATTVINVPSGWSATPSVLSSGTILKVSSTPNITTITVPAGTAQGTYYVTANSSWSNHDGLNLTNSTTITVSVVSRFNWQQSPSDMTKETVTLSQGTLGTLIENNTGSVQLLLSFNLSGNITPYLTMNTSDFLLNPGEGQSRVVSFTAPSVTQTTTYTGTIVTSNTSSEAGAQNKTVTLNLTVQPLFMNITAPTNAAPVTVVAGNLIIARINATYGLATVNSSAVWNLSLVNETSLTYFDFNSRYNSTDTLWWFNFTAPNLASGGGYDFNASLNYTAINIITNDTERRAVLYNDTTQPQILISVPSNNVVNSTISIIANITETGGVRNVTANITYPNGTAALFNMNLAFDQLNIHQYALSFADTSAVGTYGLNVTSCDNSQNCNATNTTFNVNLYTFSGSSRNEEDLLRPALPLVFSFRHQQNGSLIYNFTTDTNGDYSQNIENSTYNLTIANQNDSIRMFSTPITSHYADPARFGRIPTRLIGRGSLTGLSVNTTLNYSSANVTFSYATYNDIFVPNLGIYRCDAWNQFTGCANAWVRIGGSINFTGQVVVVNVSNVTNKAFALAEYVAGNNICESSYGESNAVSPTDCPAASSSPIAPLTLSGIAASVKSGGVNRNCDGLLNIDVIDLNTMQVQTSGNMTNFGTGSYQFNWTTPTSASIFFINASCAISGVTYSGFTLVSSQPTGATATIDYNQIAIAVWNYNYRNLSWWNTTGIATDVWGYPVRNLTYYNQSVSQSLESCLKDGQCAAWWINTTLDSINVSLVGVNTTTTNVYNDTQFLKNVFYQQNSSSELQLTTLSTPYVELNSKAEIWISAADQLGNSVSISNTTACGVVQSSTNSSIANGTMSTNLGTAYSFWIPTQTAGSYRWNCTVIAGNKSAPIQAPFWVSNISSTLSSQFNVLLSDFGSVAAGQNYRLKVWITDYLSNPKNADTTPKVNLFDPLRNQIVTDANMTLQETGIYIYNFTTSSGQTGGVWEAIATTTVNGITNKYSDFWQLSSSPVQVKINGMTDTVIPTISADVTITNEGNADTEYPYEYCIVAEQSNQCGGGDDLASGSGSKLIRVGEDFNIIL